ncbi:MAG TPA: hypothetical protein VFB22_07255 [Candidatus Baltobacteraceae bacterium]|nr:hypothetical protein [Candidatus Baltobacteraceae bacterium]
MLANCKIAPGDTINVDDLYFPESGDPALTYPTYTCTINSEYFSYVEGGAPVSGLTITGGDEGGGPNCFTEMASSFTIAASTALPSSFYTAVSVLGTFTLCMPSLGQCSSGGSLGSTTVTVQPASAPTPTPTPTASPQPNCTTQFPLPSPANANTPAITQANALILNSPPLLSLVRYLSAHGKLPAVVAFNSNGSFAAAYTPNGQLQWDSQGVASAGSITANNPVAQDPAQILYHELVHAYDQSQGFQWLSFTGLSAQIGSRTVTFTADVNGQNAIEHAYVHNAIVNAFGIDNTGALYSVFNNADQTAAQAKTDIFANQRAVFSRFSQVVIPSSYPPLNYLCPNPQAAIRFAGATITIDGSAPSQTFVNVISIGLTN